MDEPGISERLQSGIAALGSAPTAAQVEALCSYLLLLAKWNRAFNLTAVRDSEDMVVRHVLDSLVVREYLRGTAILDVGTGAGLPGIPLAIAEPERRFTLLDSVGKKIRFLRHALGELRLPNVEIVQSRAEAYQPEALYDTVVCRAFGSLGEFVAACGRLVSADGCLLAMKGRFPDTELPGVPPPWQSRCESLRVPGLDGQRHAVILERATASR